MVLELALAPEVEQAAGSQTGSTDVPGDVAIIRDVVCGAGGGRPLTMHILRPRMLPASLWLHGGGWNKGGKKSGLPRLAPFAQRGHFAPAMEHRLPGEAIFSARTEDVKCAIRCLRAKAQDLHLDPTQSGAWGGSAGGRLGPLLGAASGVAHREGNGGRQKHPTHAQAVCDVFGPADFLKLDAVMRQRHTARNSLAPFLLDGPIEENTQRAIKAVPVAQVWRDCHVFLIAHEEQDTTVSLQQIQSLYAALRRVGAPATLRVGKKGQQGRFAPAAEAMVHAVSDRRLQGVVRHQSLESADSLAAAPTNTRAQE